MKYLISIVLSISCFVCSGCAQLQTSPAYDSGFIDRPELLHQDDTLPYQGVWRKEIINGSDYDSLYVAPVNVEYLIKTSDWKHLQVLSRAAIEASAESLAGYFRETLIEALGETSVVLVEKPNARTVVLEVAIVELVPTDVVRNAAGIATGFIVPGGGLVVSAGAGGSIAIEGKYVEAKSGVELFLFKDWAQAKIAAVDLAGLTAFRHAKIAIDDWNSQIVQILTLPEGTPISGSSRFRLSPW